MSEKRSSNLVPPYIKELKPYQAGKTIAEVKETYDPPQISKLASNENRLGCSFKVQPAVENAITQIQDYPDPIARKLRTRIAERNKVSPENVILAGGSESLIANLFRTFFGDNEEAMTAESTFVGFFVHANIENVKIKKVPLTEDYQFDLVRMAESITERTKLIYIANPNNPTGTYITKAEFRTFMEKVPDDVLVVMDEAYYEYACSVKDYPRALDYSYNNILTLRTFSKAYGLAGFRIGYGIGHHKLIDMMMKTKLTFEPTSLAQAAALAAYDDTDFLARSRKVVEEGRMRLYSLFDRYDVEYVPSISNAVLLVLPEQKIAKNLTDQMLKEGVILRRVAAFGLANCIRITVGTKKEMDHFEESFQKVYTNIIAGDKI